MRITKKDYKRFGKKSYLVALKELTKLNLRIVINSLGTNTLSVIEGKRAIESLAFLIDNR